MGHFDDETAPWVDREDFAAEAARRTATGQLDAASLAQLASWRENGFLALRGAVEPALVDALLDEYEAAWRTRPPLSVLVEGHGVQRFPDVAPRETLTHHHFRLMDFQEVSATARRVMFHDTIIAAVTKIFDAPPVAMQSLLFEYPSEQRIHQDFPYVSAQVLSHLVGCWVALEEVDAENGPLFYFRGSHRLPLFDWGEGSLKYGGKDGTVEAFEDYLEKSSAEAGLDRLILEAQKGDVLLWHAALAHGGSLVSDRQRTRKSFVIHYSTREGYPRDRRWLDREPTVERIGGGLRYSEPPAPPPGIEDEPPAPPPGLEDEPAPPPPGLENEPPAPPPGFLSRVRGRIGRMVRP